MYKYNHYKNVFKNFITVDISCTWLSFGNFRPWSSLISMSRSFVAWVIEKSVEHRITICYFSSASLVSLISPSTQSQHTY